MFGLQLWGPCPGLSGLGGKISVEAKRVPELEKGTNSTTKTAKAVAAGRTLFNPLILYPSLQTPSRK
jgi:hypothetical protein